MSKPLTWPQWSRRCLALLLIACSVVPIVNLVVDPFDLFELGVVPAGPYTNQRFHHSKTLVEHPGRYNLLLLGTSIIGITPPSAVEVVVPEARAYNAGFFMATASDLVVIVKQLQAAGALPLNVVIGIDPYLFAARPADLSYEFKFPAEATGDSEVTWWSDAVFASSLSQAATKLVDLAGPVRSVQFDPATGAYSLPKAERYRLEHPTEHAAKVFKPLASPVSMEILPSEVNAFVDLIGILDDAGVNVRCFIQPMSKPMLQAQGPAALLRWDGLKRRLPLDVLDLALMPQVSNDPALFYDTKHYTPEASNLVMKNALVGYKLRVYPMHLVQR